MVGPVLPIEGHLKLFDHKDMQMRGTLHGVENVEKAVLLASGRRGEDRTLQKIRALKKDVKDILNLDRRHAQA